MVAQITVYIHRVNNVIAIKRYCRFAYWRGERVLKKTNIVVIYVNIGKHILKHFSQNFTRLYHICKAFVLLSLNNFFLSFGIFTIYVLRNGFGNSQWKDKLIVVRTLFYMVNEPGRTLKNTFLQIVRAKVVHAKRYLLVSIIRIEIVIFQMRLFLCCNYSAH